MEDEKAVYAHNIDVEMESFHNVLWLIILDVCKSRVYRNW